MFPRGFVQSAKVLEPSRSILPNLLKPLQSTNSSFRAIVFHPSSDHERILIRAGAPQHSPASLTAESKFHWINTAIESSNATTMPTSTVPDVALVAANTLPSLVSPSAHIGHRDHEMDLPEIKFTNQYTNSSQVKGFVEKLEISSKSTICTHRTDPPPLFLNSTCPEKQFIDLDRFFSQCREKQLKTLLLVLPDDRQTLFACIKYLADVRCGIQTICLEAPILQRIGRSWYAANIAPKLNTKGGGIDQCLPNLVGKRTRCYIQTSLIPSNGGRSESGTASFSEQA
ncbi:hypothetical protein HO133_001988 [Letharia lupina]|uniref:Uncharacterized protein n=1 Tax=Letharia lupina TaxID=560253 RepID=A0A8H6FB91_9LECA|nr:uncharacterized protein HO133_001988 [Letharia lupina]KAF6222020.1 hypothetical protein HO133_001988 [Letharia lupina]